MILFIIDIGEERIYSVKRKIVFKGDGTHGIATN